jgi:hypothetical protein
VTWNLLELPEVDVEIRIELPPVEPCPRAGS